MAKQLSPRDVARAMGVSESSLKRWVDEGRIAATRTAGGHRRIDQAEAIRFIRSRSAPLLHPELLGLPDSAARGQAGFGGVDEWTLDAARFEEALREGRAAEIRGIVSRLYLSGWSVSEMCDGPIREALDSIGRLWEDGPDGIYIEHRATDLCAQALQFLRTLISVPEGAPMAVGGAPAGDPHMLGSLMVTATLAAEGIQPVNLGPNSPAQAIVRAARGHRARFVWLSIGGKQLGDSLRTEIDVLLHAIDAMAAEDPGAAPFLLVGGRERTQLGGVSHPRLFIGGSLAELMAFIRGTGTGQQV